MEGTTSAPSPCPPESEVIISNAVASNEMTQWILALLMISQVPKE